MIIRDQITQSDNKFNEVSAKLDAKVKDVDKYTKKKLMKI